VQDAALPIRLATEPLVDVVFEVRFTSDIAGSNIIPGLLLSSFPEYKNFERLPAADIPEVIRNSEQGLAFAPLMRMQADRFTISVGDKVFSISCPIPYIGWAGYKKEILRISALLLSGSHIRQLSRFALRYINLLELKEPISQIAAFNWHVRLGDHEASDQSTLVRMEIRQGLHIHALQVATGVTVQTASGNKFGAIVDVDSYCECNVTPQEFIASLEQNLDSLHLENHKIFFSMLTQETLNSLGPTYHD
jgi:uncharacterized protein (TIGR04255 family)